MAAVPRMPFPHVVLVAICLLVAGACGGGAEDAAEPRETASAKPSEGGLPEVEEIAEAGGSRLDVDDADWVQVVAGSPWTSLTEGVLVRLDPETGQETARVKIPGESCTAMDANDTELVAATCSTPATVVHVDATSGQLAETVRLPGSEIVPEGSIALDGDRLWVVVAATEATRRLLQVDLRRKAVRKSYPVASGVVGVRTGMGGLWTTDPDRGVLERVDRRTGKVLSTIPTGGGARFFDVGEGAVWVQNNLDSTVSRIDPTTNKVVATIKVADSFIDGGDLAVGGGYVWARVNDSLVAQIDPATNKVVARFGPGYGSGSVAADERAAWLSAHDVDAIFRLPLD